MDMDALEYFLQGPLKYSMLGLAFAGACFLGAAARLAVRKTPLVARGRFIALFVVAPLLTPVAVFLFDSGAEDGGLIRYAEWIVVALFAGGFVGMCFQLRGYFVLGAPKESIMDAVRFSLNKNNIAFEENMLKIKLVSLGGVLRVTPLGLYFRLSAEKCKERKVLDKIAAEVRVYYNEKQKGYGKLALLHLATSGIALLAMVSLIVAELLKL